MFSGLGRLVKGLAVSASSAWLMASNPVAAITVAGSDSVQRGSTMPRSGSNARDEIPVFDFISKRSKTAMPVLSLPVPAVVGHAR